MTERTNTKLIVSTARLSNICLIAAILGGLLLAISAEFKIQAYAKASGAILGEARWLKGQLTSIRSTLTSVADLVHNADRVVQPLETPTSYFVGKGQLLRDYTSKLKPWVENADKVQDFFRRNKEPADSGNMILELFNGLNGLADAFDQMASNISGGVQNTRASLAKTESMLCVFNDERIPQLQANIETVESIARVTSVGNQITRLAYWLIAVFLVTVAVTIKRLVHTQQVEQTNMGQ